MNVRPLFLPAVVENTEVFLVEIEPAQSGEVKAAAPGEPPLKKLTNPEPTPRRGFNVVLLLGDMQDAGGLDTVPVAARKALTDMKDFLPYKGYRLLDTQWVTQHLEQFGAVEIPREDYLRRLAQSLTLDCTFT